MRYKNSYVNLTLDSTLQDVLLEKVVVAKDYLVEYFADWRQQWNAGSGIGQRRLPGLSRLSSLLGWNPRFRFKKFAPLLIIVFFVILALFVGARVVSLISRPPDSRVEVLGAKASQTINRERFFPLRDGAGTEVSQIKFAIESAELRDEIVVKGQRATAVKGRTFLILNLKITNDFNQAIEINTRDYIRLSVNGATGERLAPDIHNDPVEVQAIATKYTRVGFPVNDSDKNLLIHFGEIGGEKEQIPLTF